VAGRELRSEFQSLNKLVAPVVSWVADDWHKLDNDPETCRSDDPLKGGQGWIDTTSLV
jgi:hypothetical protein